MVNTSYPRPIYPNYVLKTEICLGLAINMGRRRYVTFLEDNRCKISRFVTKFQSAPDLRAWSYNDCNNPLPALGCGLRFRETCLFNQSPLISTASKSPQTHAQKVITNLMAFLPLLRVRATTKSTVDQNQYCGPCHRLQQPSVLVWTVDQT